MPISLAGLTIGVLRDRNALLTGWGLSSSDNDDNLRCFYQTGKDIAVFITELNIGHPKSDRTYVNWLEPALLRMEVHEGDGNANSMLRRAGSGITAALFFRRRTGTTFTYLGKLKFQGSTPFNRTQIYELSLLECSNSTALV